MKNVSRAWGRNSTLNFWRCLSASNKTPNFSKKKPLLFAKRECRVSNFGYTSRLRAMKSVSSAFIIPVEIPKLSAADFNKPG
jgi:hypothetical protein